ncbi:MAG: DUF2723 domain-containing protein, partial [Chrysiogenales bacterium]
MTKPIYPILSFFVPFSLYLATLAPTFLWSDSAKLAIFVQESDFYGFGHGYHPLHTILGIMFSKLPFELAYTQNLMSAFFAAAALFILFYLQRELDISPKISLLGCFLLSLSHSFWLYSVINETYSIHAFFIILILFMALKFRKTRKQVFFCLAYLFSGLALYNHTISLLLIPTTIILTFYQNRLHFRKILLALFFFLAGMFPLFLIPLLKLGFDRFSQTIFSETSGHFLTFFEIKKIIKEMSKFPFYLFYQFPTFAALAGIIGFKRLFKKDQVLSFSLLIFFLINTFFAFSYFLQRQFALLIPSYAVFGIWIMIGLNHPYLEERVRLKKLWVLFLYLSIVVMPQVVYYVFPTVYKNSGLKIINIRQLPYRDSIGYFFLPEKRWEYSARIYAREVLNRAEKDAVIIADFNPGMVLIYCQKIFGQRPDITIPDFIDSIVHSSPDPVRDLTRI